MKGGEGEVHRALKQRIAADPSEVLGEDGLSLFKSSLQISVVPLC
jgi:hypothetical protein